jgi:hypothetical protein
MKTKKDMKTKKRHEDKKKTRRQKYSAFLGNIITLISLPVQAPMGPPQRVYRPFEGSWQHTI